MANKLRERDRQEGFSSPEVRAERYYILCERQTGSDGLLGKGELVRLAYSMVAYEARQRSG